MYMKSDIYIDPYLFVCLASISPRYYLPNDFDTCHHRDHFSKNIMI